MYLTLYHHTFRQPYADGVAWCFESRSLFARRAKVCKWFNTRSFGFRWWRCLFKWDGYREFGFQFAFWEFGCRRDADWCEWQWADDEEDLTQCAPAASFTEGV
jgi:hypothetical protein